MKKSTNKNQVLLIGGGRRGLATIELLNEDENMQVRAVVDLNPKAAGIRLASRLGIETAREWKKYLAAPPYPDAVLNLTGDKKVQERLRKVLEGKNVELLGSLSAAFVGKLLMERQVQIELHRVSRRMASEIGLEELVILILSSCVKGTKASGGIIILSDERTGSWKVCSNWGIDEKTEGLLLKEAEAKLPLWPENDEAVELGKIRSALTPAKVSSALCAPLRFRDSIMGAIVLTPPPGKGSFSSLSVRLLSTFANQAAVAIENILLYKKSRELSVTDGLTEVFNHRYFRETLAKELSRAQRYDQNFSLIIIDLDNFKNINDNYGHLKGDRVLKRVADSLREACRESDTVARYGGDEFVLLLPETEKTGARVLAERLRKNIESLNLKVAAGLSVSVGLSAYPDDGVGALELVKKADGAMYRAKKEGKNRTCTA